MVKSKNHLGQKHLKCQSVEASLVAMDIGLTFNYKQHATTCLLSFKAQQTYHIQPDLVTSTTGLNITPVHHGCNINVHQHRHLRCIPSTWLSTSFGYTNLIYANKSALVLIHLLQAFKSSWPTTVVFDDFIISPCIKDQKIRPCLWALNWWLLWQSFWMACLNWHTMSSIMAAL